MEEKLRILKMVEEGTISAQEGADLMSAIQTTETPAEATVWTQDGYDKKLFFVMVDSPQGDKVRVQFPVGAIKKILKATGKLPISDKDLNGIDLSSLMEAISECLGEEMEGDIVNVTSSDGTIVRIYVSDKRDKV